MQISNAGNETLDFSKLVVRYKYLMNYNDKPIFWCDNAGLQLNAAQYYVSMAPAIKATFGNGYVEISFTGTQTLAPGQGSLAIGARITLENWANINGFVEEGYDVIYDGKLVSSK